MEDILCKWKIFYSAWMPFTKLFYAQAYKL